MVMNFTISEVAMYLADQQCHNNQDGQWQSDRKQDDGLSERRSILETPPLQRCC